MRKIKRYRDLEYEMEIVRIERKVELDKLKGSFNGLTTTVIPSLLTFGLINVFKKMKRKRKRRKEKE